MAAIQLTQGGPREDGNYEFTWKNGSVQAILLSDVGKKRSRNEDSCIMSVPEDKALAERCGMLFAVADGMGGASGGNLASRLALQTLVESYYGGTQDTLPKRLHEGLQKANRSIYEEAENRPEYHGMGTTVSALVIRGSEAYIAQVGDSRVYLMRGDEQIWQVTQDHSVVAEQLRNGYISEAEARNHSMKNLITRAVGTREDVKVDLFAFHIQENDTLCICSDGLSNMVQEAEIAECLAVENLQGAARILVGRALAAGGPDNITVALLRVSEVPRKTKLDEGAARVRLGRPGLVGKLLGLFS